MSADQHTLPRSSPGVCDACAREVEHVRGSIWHGGSRLCLECFYQWYDPDNASFDNRDRLSLGNYVRLKHGLPPLETAMTRQILVDHKCWELAEHFLEDVKGATGEDKQELAEQFQKTAEALCAAVEESEREKRK